MAKRHSRSIRKAVFLAAALVLTGMSLGLRGTKTAAVGARTPAPLLLAYEVLAPSELGISVRSVGVSGAGDTVAVAGVAVSGPDWRPPVAVSDWQAAVALLFPPDYAPGKRLRLEDATWVNSVRLSPRGGSLAAALAKPGRALSVLEVLSVPSLRDVAEFPEGPADSFRFATEGLLAFPSPGSSRTLRIWDFERGEMVERPLAPRTEGESRLAIASGPGLAAVSRSADILVWKLGEGTALAGMRHSIDDAEREAGFEATPEGGPYLLRGSGGGAALEFSNDGRWLASLRNLFMATVKRRGGVTEEKDFHEESSVAVWEAGSGRLITSFQTPGSIGSLGFFPDPRWLAAAFQRTIRIFDTESGLEITSLSPRIEEEGIGIVSFRVARNGTTLFAVTGDGALHIWRMGLGSH